MREEMRRVWMFSVTLVALSMMPCAYSQTFPKMSEIFIELYQTEVELVDSNQPATAIATEYYDQTQGRSSLHLLTLGNRISYYYYNVTGDLITVIKEDRNCTVSPANESMVYYYPPYYGWLNRDPVVIGPSSLLWLGASISKSSGGKDPTYKNQVNVRGILCDHFHLDLNNNENDIDIEYYFAVKEWVTPYQFPGLKLRVPVRIEINGFTSLGAAGNQMVETNQTIDFTYFRPTIDDWTKFQPELGFGCFGRRSEMVMPKLPRAFKYAAEMHNKLKVLEPDAITYEQVYFDSTINLARLDKYSRKNRTSQLYDFNNGVVYTINDRTTCKIDPIFKSFFVRDSGDFMTYLNTPQQVLGLTGDVYYMGHREYRGIQCAVFESAKRFSYYQGKFYRKLITTMFFTEEYTEVIEEGENLVRAPVYAMVTGYNAAGNVTLNLQFNMFGFNDIVGPSLYETFPIESCFPMTSQRNYFVLYSPALPGKAGLMEANDALFIDFVRSELMRTLEISDLRVPMLKADYTETGIYLTGLMLERSPSLSQFRFWFKSRVKLGQGLKLREKANSREDCATACVGETEFLCRGFHFCGQTCYIASESIDKDPVRGNEMHDCEIYLRGLANSTLNQPFLMDAMANLNLVVSSGQFVIHFEVPDKGTVDVKFTDLAIGEGPYMKNLPDRSFKMVVEGAQLYPTSKRMTTIEKDDYETELDCYQVCKDEKSIDCSTFSICPRADNKQCRISSVLVTNDDSDEIETAEECNVYSLKYLEMFTKYEEKVPFLPGGKGFENVKSAEACAKKCKLYEGFLCRGFEYCTKKMSCVLHHKHVLELTPDDFTVGSPECVHYAAKFSADYANMGPTLINEVDRPMGGKSLEECAKACSEEMPSCKSFNFCPATEYEATDSVCELTTKTLISKGVTLRDGGACRLYTKKKDVDDWGKFKIADNSVTDKKKKAGNPTGLVIGTLVFGLVVGIGIAIGYSYYRSKGKDDGMSIRFMKSQS